MEMVLLSLAELRVAMKETTLEALVAFKAMESGKELLTARETAAIFRVSAPTLFKWRQSGRLLPIKRNSIHQPLMYRAADVADLMETEPKYKHF